MITAPNQMGGAAARGMAWSLLATGGGRLINLVAVAVLARLLLPEDFGILAVALVFIGYVETLGDLGTGTALIYWPEREREVAQLTFVTSVTTSFLWLALTWALAPAVAEFFGSPAAAPVLQALAWVFPLKALGNTHDALLQRWLRFRTRLWPELALMTAKAAVAIPLAVAGFGVWSLVWGQLAGQAIATALLWALVPWRPGWGFPRHLVRPVSGYGRGVVAVNVLAAVVHHVDVVVVGRMFSAATLGFYQIAGKLPDVTVSLLVRVTSKVLFPALSRLHASGQSLRAAYLSALRYLGLMTLPVTAGLVVLAEPIVLTVFGGQWRPSIPLLQALALYAGLRALGSYAGDLLKATGRPGLLAWLAAARAVVLVPALILGGLHSILGVALALVGETLLSTGVNLAVATRLTRASGAAMWAALRPGTLVAAALALVLVPWTAATEGWPALVVVAGGGLLGLGAYSVAVRVVDPTVFSRLRRVLRQAPPDPEHPRAEEQVEEVTRV